MPTRDTEAIVLRHYPLAEADRIVVFLTRDLGTLRAVARGAKKPRSRLGGCLEPLTHVQVQVYGKEGTDLARVWQCEILHSYLGKNPTLDRVYAFTYLAELAQEAIPENIPSALFFRLLLAVLRAGERIGANAALVRYFELWALKLNGWLPDYDYCPSCRRCVKDEGFYVSLEAGVVRCRSCAAGRGIRIGSETTRLLHEALSSPPAQFASHSQSQAAAVEMERFTQKLIEWHLERRLKSYHLLKEVLENP